ncbi:MAG: glycine zipper domain-containing protein [Candidatus Omnitrophica bacterium]|nr:glycine zipper domain-containing protein [Candidatus Omnitrophota bacterium]
MKKSVAVVLGFAVVMAVVGCQSSPNRAPEGAVIGGAIGAGLGAIIGHQSGEAGKGALLGAGAGALGGALAGSQMQKEPQQQAAGQQQYANPDQMSVSQVVQLSQQGVHEDVIVDRIRMSGSRFTLSPSDVDYLQKQGVSQKVISAMQGY